MNSSSLPIKRHKCNKVELDNRISIIVQMLYQGVVVGSIVNKRKLASKWNVSVKAIEKYCKKANIIMLESIKANTDDVKAWAIGAYMRTYRKAQHDRDKIDAISRICKLYGLENNDINVHIDKCAGISDDKLIEILQDNEPN